MTVYDLLPEFDSYVADMETNLEMDTETWAAYRKNPRPFLYDLLCDFSTNVPENFEAAVATALDAYC